MDRSLVLDLQGAAAGPVRLLNLDFTTLDKPKINSLTVVVRGAGFEKHRTYERRPDELTEAILAKGTTTVVVTWTRPPRARC